MEIVQINKTFTEMIGYTLKEIQEIGFNNIVEEYHNIDFNIHSYSQCFTDFFNGNISACNAEIKIRTKNSEYKWLRQNCDMVYTNERLI